MKPVWSVAAVRSLQEVAESVQVGNDRGAVSLRRRILETVERVGQMPYFGSVGRIEGTREAVVPRSPYVVIYHVSGKGVEIVGLWRRTGRKIKS